MVGYQSITLGLVTLILGLPIGLVAGRLLWSAATQRTGITTFHAEPTSIALTTTALALAASATIGAIFVVGMRRHPLHAAIRAD